MAGPPMSMFSIASSSVTPGLGDGRGERVEVHADEVDGRDAVLLDRRHVLGEIATGEDAAMHLRMQRLDAAVEHFREAGVIADLGDGRPASRSILAVPPVDSSLTPWAASPGRIEDAGLVGNGKEGLTDLHDVGSAKWGFESEKVEFGEFLAQRVAIDAEHLRGQRLVAIGVAHHHFEHGLRRS